MVRVKPTQAARCISQRAGVAMQMDQQTGPSAARRLLDLPLSCLHHIVSFMDKQTKLQLFRTSKGSLQEAGCAVVVLTAAKLTCSMPGGVNPKAALRRLLHWASQISTDVQLTVVPQYDEDFQLCDALHRLLLYPAARDTYSGLILGSPATYPGIISLKLEGYTSASLIPGLVADAFPNLKSFTATWTPDESQPLGPVLQRGLSYIEHVEVDLADHTADELEPAARQHVAQQLGHMPSLTSMYVDKLLFQAVPTAALAKLKQLLLYAYGDPTAKDKAALKACTRLESLALSVGPGAWVQALPQLVPSIRSLEMTVDVTDKHLPSLLALPHLTSLTVNSLQRLPDDYSTEPCRWKRFQTLRGCSNVITKLPLHTLDSPIECELFMMTLSDYASDLAAIRAAKPHLLRCGGIKVRGTGLSIHMADGHKYTKKEVAEVLEEWAPCWPVYNSISCQTSSKPIIEDAVERLWPAVKFTCWG